MGRTFAEFTAELLGHVPRLGPFAARLMVERAWRDIRDARLWGFLRAEGVLRSIDMITAGRMTVTTGSNLVVADATARAALGAQTDPPLTKLQIRFGSGPTPIYSIAAVDPNFATNGRIFLDRLYREASGTTSYRAYRAYYGGPEVATVDASGNPTTTETTDFVRFNSIYNPTNSTYFTRLHVPEEDLDWRDPQRAFSGQIPIWLVTRRADASGNPQFEIWPHPTSKLVLIANYQRRGLDSPADTDRLPPQIPDDLLMSRALVYACEWAAKHAANYAELGTVNWRQEANFHALLYEQLLLQAMRQDEEAFPQNQIVRRAASRELLIGDDVRAVYTDIAWRS